MLYDVAVLTMSTIYYWHSALYRHSGQRRLAWFKMRKRNILPPLPVDRRPLIWIHAVSAGEVKVAEKLAEALRRLLLRATIVISSSTEAGYAKAQNVIEADVAIVMPLDLRKPLQQIFQHLQPSVLITVESELWPHLFRIAEQMSVPINVTNATLSDRSFKNFKKHGWFAKATLSKVSHFYCQNMSTMSRLNELGVADNKIDITGNMKLSPPSRQAIAHAQALVPACDRRETKTITFGNIHPAEIKDTRDLICRLHSVTDTRVLIVPRHIDKFTPKDIKTTFGDDVKVVSDISEISPSDRLVWVSAMHILEAIYAATDIAVVMGTFCDVGGHDLVEPVHFGALTFYGPNVEKQMSLHAEMSALMPWAQVRDYNALYESLVEMLEVEYLWNTRVNELHSALAQFASITNDVACAIVERNQLKDQNAS
ncbi:MAG: 3-deoxy-D-manno-octulosonic acid transferase [Schlesneria sp.]|nr:3-deoxy-D-manno-octulosonic acid transferase [Schlesneria sp.]